ncbi:MAG: prepilin-type N-terminal cleavage/methylation domain-containing protein [Campylobacter sp.]|uniref:prepilin-type N-terminal cleavage/methylation domain-containing protein n=1 Tax=Campylobacter sp. TaxID=205 RepID=UPI002A910C5B|nr:prepilin-type N-terminal cleavage/methylation domain-containing protein [Campylobacter sp.]MDY6188238.1 prepilin-type N-terminal cleavage/methylation domain-containing protein [Campylobacter sp.]
MKRAFSLIELLLAIVVVGVAVAALPFIATSTGKANSQAVVSEVVTSSRIFIDDILSEPWNSAITNGFVNSSGAVLYSGILEAENDDARFNDKTKKYFNRTLARDKEGKAIKAVRVGSCDTGINCKNNTESSLKADGKSSKNAFDVTIKAEVKFIEITERTAGKKITATFSDTKTAAGTTNAILVSATATGKDKGNIIDDVNEIRLNGFAFNIGTESR